MPHLKVNVNGERYTISGLTRSTCSKQILCALAKVDAELQANKALIAKRDLKDDSADSASEEHNERLKKVRKSRTKSKRVEKCKTDKEAEKKDKARGGRKHARSTKKIAELFNKGIQTSNEMLETLAKVAESQQNCLLEKHAEDNLKVEDLGNSLQTVKDLNGTDIDNNVEIAEDADRKGTGVEDQTKDTDHDTGISELHSDSSFETSHIQHNNEKEDNTENGGKKNFHSASTIEVRCASTNTDPTETADNKDACMRESENENSMENRFIVAQLLGSETDTENNDECACNCVYVDSDSEELQEEIEKVREDLKSTEARLAEQNKMIESLSCLIHADQLNAKGRLDNTKSDVNGDASDDVTKRIGELKQSIKLSNQLYDYQKIETQANALELERVESQIRRKRWHVESLLKKLRSVSNNSAMTRSGQGKTIDYRREGTLV